MDVSAVIVCGTPGVDALTRVAGVPMLVHAVESLLGAGGFGHVQVLATQSYEHARLTAACAGLPVVVHPHALQRGSDAEGDGSGTLRRIVGAAEFVIVHDVAWALVAGEVVKGLLGALADGHEAVVPVVPLTDTVKDVDPAGLVIDTPDRSGLRVVQTPQAYRSTVFDRAVPPASGLAELAAAVAASGIGVHTVPGDPRAFALRTGDDVELARAVVRGEQQ